jgi:hypothetical protein
MVSLCWRLMQAAVVPTCFKVREYHTHIVIIMLYRKLWISEIKFTNLSHNIYLVRLKNLKKSYRFYTTIK